jgi:hypothetical protein
MFSTEQLRSGSPGEDQEGEAACRSTCDIRYEMTGSVCLDQSFRITGRHHSVLYVVARSVDCPSALSSCRVKIRRSRSGRATVRVGPRVSQAYQKRHQGKRLLMRGVE